MLCIEECNIGEGLINIGEAILKSILSDGANSTARFLTTEASLTSTPSILNEWLGNLHSKDL